MAIDDKHKFIPKELASSLYIPDNSSPNSNSFRVVRQKGDPIQPVGLDNIAMWLSDALQEIDIIIDTINTDKLGIEGGKGAIVFFSDENVLASADLQSLITTIPRLKLDNPDIKNLSGDAISNYSIKKEKYAPLSILNAAIAKETIEADKLKGLIPVSKLSPPKAAAVICGTYDRDNPANCKWYEEDLESYEIITKLPNDNGAKGVPLSFLWDSAPYTFDGGKLAPDSIDGSIAMKSNSTPLATLKSSGDRISVVCGTLKANGASKGFVKEVTLKPLQVISLRSNGAEAESMKVSELINNEQGSPIKWSKIEIEDGSIPLSKLEAQTIPYLFLAVSCDRDGHVRTSYNLKEVKQVSLGKYLVSFTKLAKNKNAFVSLTTNEGKGIVAMSDGQGLDSIEILTKNMNGQQVSGGFDLMIFDF